MNWACWLSGHNPVAEWQTFPFHWHCSRCAARWRDDDAPPRPALRIVGVLGLLFHVAAVVLALASVYAVLWFIAALEYALR